MPNTAAEKIAELEEHLAEEGYTYDRRADHENGVGLVYQQTDGLNAPKIIVIACEEGDISLE